MDVHHLPLVLFTVIGQMCVGTFLCLGVMQLVVSARHGRAVAQRIIEPVVYAIGPVMVLGLVASMFHMHDITHTLNVIRHWRTSWLSREIIFGIGFAGLGFAYALLEWFEVAGFRLRQVVAALTALFGIALVWSMAQIYYSVPTIPAWHNWAVPFQFFGTTAVLGPLAVGCALMATAALRARHAAHDVATPAANPAHGGPTARIRGRIRAINAPATAGEWAISTSVVRWLALVAAVAAAAVLISYTLYVSGLTGGNAQAQLAAGVFSGPLFAVRLTLLGLAAIVLGLFVFRVADRAPVDRSWGLAALMATCQAGAFVAEVIGRFFHYAAMYRVGI